MTPPPQEAVDRFRRDLLRLADGPIGLAVSGGPDSLALLLLAREVCPEGQIAAATVDHRLRPDSAAEAATVARLCDALAVPHATLSVTVVPDGSGLQAAARAARYRALGAWAADTGLATIATAHHADDQAETLLMRLARGSGLAGLAGVRESRPLAEGAAIRLVRPLLGWRKAALEAIVAGAGLEPLRDPSNDDPRHDRTHARALLAREPGLDPLRLAASAGALAEAEAALAWTTAELMAARLHGDALDVAGLPRELRRRLLAALLPEARGDAVVRLLDRLDAGESGTLADRLVRPHGAVWRIEPAPPRRAG